MQRYLTIHAIQPDVSPPAKQDNIKATSEKNNDASKDASKHAKDKPFDDLLVFKRKEK